MLAQAHPNKYCNYPKYITSFVGCIPVGRILQYAYWKQSYENKVNGMEEE